MSNPCQSIVHRQKIRLKLKNDNEIWNWRKQMRPNQKMQVIKAKEWVSASKTTQHTRSVWPLPSNHVLHAQRKNPHKCQEHPLIGNRTQEFTIEKLVVIMKKKITNKSDEQLCTEHESEHREPTMPTKYLPVCNDTLYFNYNKSASLNCFYPSKFDFFLLTNSGFFGHSTSS